MSTYGTPTILSGFRRVQIAWGDTLQRVAARELGDASLWTRIAAINDLAPPYVTGDKALANARVLLYGDTIIIPAPRAEVAPGKTWSEDVFLQDVSLTHGALSVIDGDFAIAAGRANLRQSLHNRVVTEPGELVFHPRYGCRVHELKGRRNDAVAGLLGAAHVRDAVLADPRVASILDASAAVEGDTIRIEVEAQTVSGHPVDVKAEA